MLEIDLTSVSHAIHSFLIQQYQLCN